MSQTSSPTQRLAAPSSLPEGMELVLRVIPMPADSNANGDIFGGWIMAQVDVAGAVLPARIARGRIVTVAVNQFVFKQPVSVGDLLSFYAACCEWATHRSPCTSRCTPSAIRRRRR